MEINLFLFLIFFSSIIIASLGLVIYLGSNNLSSRAFVFCMFLVSIWIASVGFLIIEKDYNYSIFLSRSTYFLGCSISLSFIYFFLTFPDDRKPSNYIFSILIFFGVLFSFIFLNTKFIISHTFLINSPSRWGWEFGKFSYLFEIVFFGLFILGLIILFKKYFINKNNLFGKNLKFMIITIMVGALPPSILSIILPRFGYFNLNWLGPVMEIIWIPIISYSIIKYRQMNVRAVVIEVLAIGMTIIFFIDIFINSKISSVRLMISFLFVCLLIYLIRSSLFEAKQKESLRILNLTLEEKIAEQTAEVRKAFELEKTARRELEKLNETKDQFIMITQHHLRTPATTIKWELEALLTENRNDISSDLRNSLNDMNIASNRLIRIIDDFLDITALKVGSQILNISMGNIKNLIDDVLNELKITINKENIKVNFIENDQIWLDMKIDQGKIREVLLIVLENAVRYNHKGGNIDIEYFTDNENLKLIITNTGLGISNEENKNLFSRLFYRGKKAQKAHPIGMGIGLSVARAIINAHHGDISIESKGENMGAKVILRIPLDFINDINKDVK